MLIRDRLDAAFDTEPPEVPVAERLTAGRAALRRRRLGQGAASVAAVALICTGAVVVVGSGAESGERLQPSRSSVHATTTTTADETTPRPGNDDGSGTTKAWPYPGQPAYVDDTGRLHLATGVTLVRKVSAPAKPPDDWAIQVAVRSDHEVWWLAMTWKRGADATVYSVVGPFDSFQPLRFRDWVLQQSYRADFFDPTSTEDTADDSSGSAIRADLHLVRFEGNTLTAEPGVTILEQRPDPHFTNFAQPGDRVGVAEVRDGEGKRWFVIVRSDGAGAAQDIVAPPGVDGIPDTLDEFIAWAAQKYDSGVGLL